MKKVMYSMLAAIALLAITTSCTKVPQAEMDTAKAAVAEASSYEAEVYVPEQFSAVNDSLDKVINQIEAKRSKWFKNFKEEKEKLANITAMAEQTRINAENRKNELIDEYQMTLQVLTKLIEENKTLLTQAPTGKEGKAAVVSITNENVILESSINESNALLAEKKVIAALNKVKASVLKARQINEELKTAIAKAGKKGNRKF